MSTINLLVNRPSWVAVRPDNEVWPSPEPRHGNRLIAGLIP
jgi:hypothetical protein